MRIPDIQKRIWEIQYPMLKQRQIDDMWKERCSEIRNETSAIRTAVLDEDSECEICGFGFSPALQIHHILPVSVGGDNDTDNLACLCPTCHAVLHIVYKAVEECDEPLNEKIMSELNASLGVSAYSNVFNLFQKYLRKKIRYTKAAEEKLVSVGGEVEQFSDIYSRVKTACRERGISVSTLEYKLGLSKGSVLKWQRSSPSFKTVCLVAKELSKPIEYFA